MSKYKKYHFSLTVSWLILALGIQAQTSLPDFLLAVKQNNKTLKSLAELNHAQKLQAKTGLTLESPEFEFGYFPGKSSEMGIKKVLGASQAFDFPTTYIHRSKISEKHIHLSNIELKTQRLIVIKNAKSIWIKTTYLNKKKQFTSKRYQDALTLANSYQKKFENHDVTQLEINKARLFKLKIQNESRMLTTEIQQNQQEINLVNGGFDYKITDTLFYVTHIPDWESFSKKIQEHHPELKRLGILKDLNAQEIKLKKAECFPKFTIAYEQESVSDEVFRGIKSGISMPIWQNKNKVKTANAELLHTIRIEEEYQANIMAEYYKRYLKSVALANNLSEFKTKLNEMNNLYLLQRSLALGQISAIEYFTELDYFYNIADELLALEYEYQLSIIELFDFME